MSLRSDGVPSLVLGSCIRGVEQVKPRNLGRREEGGGMGMGGSLSDQGRDIVDDHKPARFVYLLKLSPLYLVVS